MSHAETIGEIGNKTPFNPVQSELAVILDVDGTPLELANEFSGDSSRSASYFPKTYSPAPDGIEAAVLNPSNLYPVKLPDSYVFDTDGHAYRLEGQLSHTSNSRVIRGENIESGKVVALKFTDADRVIRERSNILSLSDHPNVVSLAGSGLIEDGYGSALVTEFINGQPLDKYIPSDPREAGMEHFAEAIDAVIDSIDVVRAVHKQGRVFMDYKPQNVMVVDSRGVVLDVEDIERAGLTTGQIRGTLDFMPAEALRDGEAEIRQESDIYAIGLTLGMLIAGKNRELGRIDTEELGETQRHEKLRELEGGRLPVDLAKVHKLAPAPLAEVIDGSVDPNPNNRVDIDEVVIALEDARYALKAA